MRVLVVGAGVVGLTCAVRLLEAGHRVDVLARDLPRETTSAVAAAIWYPYLALPRERVTGWGARTFEVLSSLATGPEADAGAGVALRAGTEVLREPPEGEPWWAGAVPGLAAVRDPVAGFAAGWRFETPVVEMPVYLAWLAACVDGLGGTITRVGLAELPRGDGTVVVDCAGLGARLLAADRGVTPVRGQVVVVEQVGLEEWWLDGDGPTYVVPRTHDVVVGGTEETGEWSRTPSPATAMLLLERATALEPRLAGARVLRHKVGLRPARPAVRVERVDDVVHCYGHGGAGVTLSWGCAEEVVTLVGT